MQQRSENHIMPDRSLTLSKRRAFWCLSNLFGFINLSTSMLGMDAGQLPHQEVEGLFRMNERRALQIMGGLNDGALLTLEARLPGFHLSLFLL